MKDIAKYEYTESQRLSEQHVIFPTQGVSLPASCPTAVKAITVPEMFMPAKRIVSVTYEPRILYIEAARIYLMFSTVLSHLQARLEKHYQHHLQR